MLIQLALKELRETAWMALIALAAYFYFVFQSIGVGLIPWQSGLPYRAIPFVNDAFLTYFAIVSVCLAIALGRRQSAVELRRGTFLFLLHRPISRSALIGTKLAVGAGLYLTCAAIPILIYAAWAATPGTHASPFEWAMTATAWKVWMTLPLLYLGSFLTGIRPARWFGTRLVPLMAVGALCCVLPIPQVVGIFGIPVLFISVVVLVGSILHVAQTRDF